MALFEISFTILDAKNQRSVMSFHVEAIPTDDPPTMPSEYARDYALLLDPLITGQIIAIGVHEIVPVPDGVKLTPLVISDVEDGALFTWRTQNNTVVKQRLPTFSEDLIDPGTFFVDIEDPDVDEFIFMNTHPSEMVADWQVGPVSHRGERYLDLQGARENFKKSRAKKRRKK